MTNKEIKKGDMIWLFSPYISKDSGYLVKSVKKEKTLVSVVVETDYYDKKHELTMYGHASSSMLSGYDRIFRQRDCCYTCDYSLVEHETRIYDFDVRRRRIGSTLLDLISYIKHNGKI